MGLRAAVHLGHMPWALTKEEEYTYCCVYSTRLLMMDRNCPKHVEFYSKNKFEKLVHLVGFIIRIQNVSRFLPNQEVSHPRGYNFA
jgi:hypothetical protein